MGSVSMPSAGYSHFYKYVEWRKRTCGKMCQCPRRAILISTITGIVQMQSMSLCVNALGGLFSFLQYPLETRINTGFPAPFLQVFV